jgi:hypothetical protein
MRVSATTFILGWSDPTIYRMEREETRLMVVVQLSKTDSHAEERFLAEFILSPSKDSE